MTVKVAVVQKPPVLLDLGATMARALESLAEAAGEGSNLVVFPEAYLPGYPTWVWRLRPGGDMGLSSEIHARLRDNASISRRAVSPPSAKGRASLAQPSSAA